MIHDIHDAWTGRLIEKCVGVGACLEGVQSFFSVIITGNGEVKEITLPDGSTMTLNTNSNLTWVIDEKKGDDRLMAHMHQ